MIRRPVNMNLSQDERREVEDRQHHSQRVTREAHTKAGCSHCLGEGRKVTDVEKLHPTSEEWLNRMHLVPGLAATTFMAVKS